MPVGVIGRIGLIGHLEASAADLAVVAAAVPTLIAEFAAAKDLSQLELMTPLAPGGDVMLTGCALDTCAVMKLESRVVVVRALPDDIVLELYKERVGGQLAGTALECRRTILGRADITSLCVRPTAATAEFLRGDPARGLRDRAFRRANTYLITKVDMLVALLRSRLAPNAQPGGTADAVVRACRFAAKRGNPVVVTVSQSEGIVRRR